MPDRRKPIHIPLHDKLHAVIAEHNMANPGHVIKKITMEMNPPREVVSENFIGYVINYGSWTVFCTPPDLPSEKENVAYAPFLPKCVAPADSGCGFVEMQEVEPEKTEETKGFFRRLFA